MMCLAGKYPHLTSPWEGKGQAGGSGALVPQEQMCFSPFEGEAGWGPGRPCNEELAA